MVGVSRYGFIQSIAFSRFRSMCVRTPAHTGKPAPRYTLPPLYLRHPHPPRGCRPTVVIVISVRSYRVERLRADSCHVWVDSWVCVCGCQWRISITPLMSVLSFQYNGHMEASRRGPQDGCAPATRFTSTSAAKVGDSLTHRSERRCRGAHTHEGGEGRGAR